MPQWVSDLPLSRDEDATQACQADALIAASRDSARKYFLR